MGSSVAGARREPPLHRLVILDADYRIQYMNDFPLHMPRSVCELADRLPHALECTVRLLTESWGKHHVLCPERRCIVACGLAMRVFVLAGAQARRIGVAFEPYRERLEDRADPVGAFTY